MILSVVLVVGGMTALAFGLAFVQFWWVGGGPIWFSLGATTFQLAFPIGFIALGWYFWPRGPKSVAAADEISVTEPSTRPVFRVLGTIAAVAMYATLAPLFVQGTPRDWNHVFGPLLVFTLVIVGLVYRVWTIK